MGIDILLIRLLEYKFVNLLIGQITFTYISKFERHNPFLETSSPCICLIFLLDKR
jgi:hypothetical protein